MFRALSHIHRAQQHRHTSGGKHRRDCRIQESARHAPLCLAGRLDARDHHRERQHRDKRGCHGYLSEHRV